MNRLGGWTRIGIVISILWSFAVFGFAAIEYFDCSTERKEYLSLPGPPKGFVLDPKTQAFFFEWQSAADVLAKDSSAYVSNFQLQGSRLLGVWLSPFIVFWLFSFVIVITFKWVKAGFSKKHDISS